MELKIQKIYVNDLAEFWKSIVQSDYEHLPISLKRVNSYFHNPNKVENLPVLYLGYLDGKLISYRSVLQDKFKKTNGELVNFAWLSGVWVHEDFRRKGLASKLLNEVYSDYNGKILSTNLGANSQKLMEGNDKFVLLKDLTGKRFYYRFSLAKILPAKSNFFRRTEALLKLTDGMGNFILNLKPQKKAIQNHFENAELNDELKGFISQHNSDSLLKRNTEELNWILKYPWVVQSEKDEPWDKKYHFTSTSKQFYKKLKLIRENQQIKGFLMYSARNGTLKVHYLFADSLMEIEAFSAYLLGEVSKEKMDCLLTTDSRLIEKLSKKGKHIYSKDWMKKYFAGKELVKTYPELAEKAIYLGDGDSVFV